MRILILRTIAHNKIWEGIEPTCHYENQAYEIIKTWEANIINYKLEEIKYGIGIYTKQYFNYVSPKGIKASTDTIQENQPSLLNLKSINNSASFIEDKSNIIRINFELNKKYEGFDKEKMFELDEKLVNFKIQELRQKPNTQFPSLCFSLKYLDAVSILNQFEVIIN
jgi:hypothetical protein